MACPAGPKCLIKNLWAKIYLGKLYVEPPAPLYEGLITEKGKEPTGPSYRRQPVRFVRGANGLYANDAPLKFRPTHVDEDWGRITHTFVSPSPESSELDCRCLWSKCRKGRVIEAGDVLFFEKGDARPRQFGGAEVTEYVNQKLNDFLYGGIDFDPPSKWWMGLFSASPDHIDDWDELQAEGYERKPIRFTYGRDAVSTFVAHDVDWTVTGTWDVAGLGVFDSPEPLKGNLWCDKKSPFGGRTLEAGDHLIQRAGEWGFTWGAA